MDPTTPHVIVVDDKSPMWGNEVRVVGPYPDRPTAMLDYERVATLYPNRAFIAVTPLTPGLVVVTPPVKGKARLHKVARP